MELTWWGTAALRLRASGHTFWVDPYLTRNPQATPRPALTLADFDKATAVFMTHGHFDHARDASTIANFTDAPIFCNAVTGRTLLRDGLRPHLLRVVEQDGWRETLGPLTATARHSRHISFDARLVLRTVGRLGRALWPMHALMRRYPCGQVLSWRLEVEGRSLLIFGSGGSTAAELADLAQTPTDVLFAPLQGHSRICQLALNYVTALRPQVVVPFHHDDFYPPLSQMVDIAPFVAAVEGLSPAPRLIVPQIGRPIVP